MAWQNYIENIGSATYADRDRYGDFIEYEITLSDDMLYRAMDQMREYLPTDDSYMDAYLRRYADGSSRIWLAVNEDFNMGGRFVEEEFLLSDGIRSELDEIALDF